jgi:hypothetical protein
MIAPVAPESSAETQTATPIKMAVPRLRLAALLFIRSACLGYDGLAYNFHATA